MTDQTTHPSDEDLILLFYGELPGDELDVVRAHVDTCAACCEALRLVTRTLELATTGHVPEPDAGFEGRIWAGVSPHISKTSLWGQ